MRIWFLLGWPAFIAILAIFVADGRQARPLVVGGAGTPSSKERMARVLLS